MADEDKQAKPDNPGTEYAVLEHVIDAAGTVPTGFDGWVNRGNFRSKVGGTDAIRKALVALGLTQGEFVAVPTRSFKPVTVRAEPREPRLVIGS